eukprot:jgi/Pico_ML_1/52507/g3204.t1
MKATCLRKEGKVQASVIKAARRVDRTKNGTGDNVRTKACARKTKLCRPMRENVVQRTRCRVADVESADGGSTSEEKQYAEVDIDCEADPNFTVISIKASNRPGLLSAMTKTFRDLGIDVNKAVVDSANGVAVDTFYVLDSTGKKITSERDVRNVKSYIMTFLESIPTVGRIERPALAFLKQAQEGTADERRKSQLLYNLMDTYTKNDVLSIQESIVNHVEYTLGRSRYKFDNFEAYQATALAVRDRLIEVFNDTQHHFYESDPKRVYYLSMEFLMGRSLLNSLYNLSLKDEFEQALRYNTDNTINLRLWSGKPDHEFDLESFNTGDYVSAILAKQRAETISSVLYPDDRTYEGKELRLRQQHFMIIYDINWRFLQAIKEKVDDATLGRLSIIEDSPYDGEKFVRMAYLAMVASHTVNGVAAIHSELIKETIFADFYKIWPEKFQNKTNGVTQRRWLAFCNPKLRGIISETLGTEEWITDLDLLTGLKEHAEDPELQKKWQEVKQHNKAKLADLVFKTTGIQVSTNAMFDIQVKRIHEYKRQLLNILSVIDRYAKIRVMSEEEKKSVVPRVVIIGGKAAPGYDVAKRIIKLVSAVGDRVNNDPAIGDLLKVVFIPDYNVSLAETIIPGSELSQHISTAGTEASGTSNMKFAMNGSLIIGTMDGANVEIAEEIGEENMFIFGVRAPEVPRLRESRGDFQAPERFNEAVSMISRGEFGWSDFFQPLVDNISGSTDFYLLANDFLSYVEAQDQVDAAYRDQARWTKMSILSVAGSGKFSSDRTIQQYAKEIWGICPCCLKDA